MAENVDWNKVQQDEGWVPVKLEEVIGKDVPEAEVKKRLEDKGYFLLDNGKWQSPDANTYIEDYTSVPEESMTQEPSTTRVEKPSALEQMANTRQMKRNL